MLVRLVLDWEAEDLLGALADCYQIPASRQGRLAGFGATDEPVFEY